MNNSEDRCDAPDHSSQLGEYLLHEFDHIAAALQQNEDAGERRVQFFMTVVAAVFGIIALAFRNETETLADAVKSSWLQITLGLSVLLLFGISTLIRIVQRNTTSDKYKFALRSIRRRFVSRAVAKAHPTAFFEPYKPMSRRNALSLKGGWFEIVALLNSAILGVMAWLLQNHESTKQEGPILWLTIVAVILALAGQVVYAQTTYKKEWAKLDEADARSGGLRRENSVTSSMTDVPPR